MDIATQDISCTLHNALENVDISMSANPADGPISTGILYTSLRWTNYTDHKAYHSSEHPHLTRETVHMTKMEAAMDVGKSFMWMLYAYRSCARAIPQVQQTVPQSAFPETPLSSVTPTAAGKDELYYKTYELLRPEIIKMKRLMKYCDELAALVCEVITGVLPDHRENFASADFLFTLAKTLNHVVVMDALKNMKASLNNDFSMYKRALSNLTKSAHNLPDETVENHQLYLFLGNHDRFAAKLKEELANVKGFEDVLIDMANTCADMFENKMYVEPQSKHLLLKAMAFGLSLADQPGDEKDITKRKKQLKLDRFAKIIRAMPVVPLFGDMSIKLSSLFAKTPHLSSMKWDTANDEPVLVRSYSILAMMETTQKEYDDVMCALGNVVNAGIMLEESEEPALQVMKNVYDVMLSGLVFVSHLTAKVLEQSAWKFTNPTNSTINPKCPDGASLYEMAVRYNYSSEELYAVLECVFMIKNLANILAKADSLVLEVVRKYIYADVQIFVRGTLDETIGHTVKKKKAIASTLKHIRSIAADWKDGSDISDENGTPSPVKSKQELAVPTVPNRKCGIALSQLRFIRALLDQSYSDKAKGMKGGLLKEKDFKESQVDEMTAFYDRSFFYAAMLDFKDTLMECSDLSDLWYKEFYLELSHEIQFPIEMSLPWMITECVLESEDRDILEYLMFPFDIYNDSANRALHRMRTQYMYDEIEAEMNLCFDQFIFKLSEKIFLHYKTRASSMRLDKNFKTKLNSMANNADTRWEFSYITYTSILRTRQYQFLGRNVDIGKSVTQTVNQHLRKSLDVAISRFESSELGNVVELDNLIENARLAHRLMSEHLDLDAFDDMLIEIDDRTSLLAFEGRIIAHLVAELTGDFISNYCYNSATNRFVRTTRQVADPVQRPPLSKANPIFMYGAKNIHLINNVSNRMFNNFLDATHFQIIIKLIGRKSVPVIIGELLKNLKQLLTQEATLYINALGRGLPQFFKLPLFEYGPKGTYDYFQAILRPVLTYPELQTEVFQAFREIGNTILAVRMIEDALTVEETFHSLQTAVFFEKTPTFSSFTKEIPQFGSVEDTYGGYRRTHLMRSFLNEMREHLLTIQTEWQGTPASAPLMSAASDQSNAPVLLSADSGHYFSRIWSSMQFAFCSPSDKFSVREAYGESLQWAGCTLIYLLGQVDRFTASDFSYHVTYVFAADRKSQKDVHVKEKEKEREVAAPVELQRFIEAVEFGRSINENAFDYLQVVTTAG